ncbi:radical SAM protein [bacterium]|nr:radical SAM protein [bacterium]
MRVLEIYRSIQGESSFAGKPCTFIRVAGCSLRCPYCDTKYALSFTSGDEWPLEALVEKVRILGTDLVEITGGEPLEQEETPLLCRQLLDLGATVLVETSGAFPIADLPAGTISILDIKTPSSKMEQRNEWSNLQSLSEKDEIKFVISDRADFDWSVGICEAYNLWGSREILFSAACPEIEPIELAQWILEENIPVRLQMQLHKIIWSPDARGV